MKKDIKILTPSEQMTRAVAKVKGRTDKDVASYGLVFLDNYLGWIERGELVVVWWNTGNWKTELSHQMAMENVEIGRKVLLIWVEGEQDEFYNRKMYQYIRDTTNIGIVDYRLNNTDDKQELDKKRDDFVEKYKTKLNENFRFLDNTQISDWQDIEESVKILIEGDFIPDIIIVDHLHYILKENQNEVAEINQTMKNIQLFIREQNIWLVLFSHVNRGLWTARPRLHELHGSSAIEKIAFTVIMIYRRDRDVDDKVNLKAIMSEDVKTITEFNILKSRKWLQQISFRTVFDPVARKFVDDEVVIWATHMDETDDEGKLLDNLKLSFKRLGMRKDDTQVQKKEDVKIADRPDTESKVKTPPKLNTKKKKLWKH